MEKDVHFHLRNGYVIGTIFLQIVSIARPTISHVFSIYHRTAIDLRVAIYELERALHDRRRVNIIFWRKEAWERPSIR